MRSLAAMGAILMLALPSFANGQDASGLTDQDREEQKRQDARAEKAEREREEYMQTSFAARYIGGEQLKRDLLLDPRFPRVTLIVDKSLVREAKPTAMEASFERRARDAGLSVAYPFDVKVGNLNVVGSRGADYYVVRCISGDISESVCMFSTSQDPDDVGYSIPGTVFVVPGDGCIYSTGDVVTLFENPAYGAQAKNCVIDGILQPMRQAL